MMTDMNRAALRALQAQLTETTLLLAEVSDRIANILAAENQLALPVDETPAAAIPTVQTVYAIPAEGQFK